MAFQPWYLTAGRGLSSLPPFSSLSTSMLLSFRDTSSSSSRPPPTRILPSSSYVLSFLLLLPCRGETIPEHQTGRVRLPSPSLPHPSPLVCSISPSLLWRLSVMRRASCLPVYKKASPIHYPTTPPPLHPGRQCGVVVRDQSRGPTPWLNLLLHPDPWCLWSSSSSLPRSPHPPQPSKATWLVGPICVHHSCWLALRLRVWTGRESWCGHSRVAVRLARRGCL